MSNCPLNNGFFLEDDYLPAKMSVQRFCWQGLELFLGQQSRQRFWVVAFIFDPIFGDLQRERRPYDQELGLGLFQPPSFSAYPFSVDGLRFHRVRAAPALCAFAFSTYFSFSLCPLEVLKRRASIVRNFLGYFDQKRFKIKKVLGFLLAQPRFWSRNYLFPDLLYIYPNLRFWMI